MIAVMDWDDWIKLTDDEQAEVRRRHERPGSSAMPDSLSADDQRELLHALTRPLRQGETE